MRCRGLFVIGLVFLLSTGGLATPKITVWITYGGIMGEVLQRLIDEDFTPKTGIEVEYIPEMVDTSFMQKVIMAFLGGDAPDVFTHDGYGVIELGLRGLLEDLTQFPDHEAAFSHMYPGLFGQAQFRGALYGVPGESQWMQAYYRMDLLESIGAEPPQTWEELAQLMPKLTSRDSRAFYSDLGRSRNYLPFIYQQGVDIFSPDGLQTNLDSSEALTAFREFTGLYTQHNMALEFPSIPGFGSGEIGYLLDLHWIYGLLDHVHPQIQGKWGVSQYPGTLRDGVLYRTVPVTSFHYLIPKNRKDQVTLEAAWEFIKWLSSPEIAHRFQEGIYQSPERWILTFGSEQSVATAAFRSEDRAIVDQILRSARTPMPVVGGNATYRYIDFAFNRVVLQKVDPKEALKMAARESEAELRRKQVEFARFLR